MEATLEGSGSEGEGYFVSVVVMGLGDLSRYLALLFSSFSISTSANIHED